MRTLSVAILSSLMWVPVALAADAAKAPDDVQVVTATGEVAVVNGDVPAAKEKARDAALREAVAQVVGTTITSATESQDFTLVRDIVFSHTAGYVRKYEKVSEKVHDDVASVTVRAEVARSAVDKDAAAVATLLNFKKQRRVYVAVNDVSMETAGQKEGKATVTSRHGVFDSVFREALRKDGFTTLDPNLVDGKLKAQAAVQAITNPAAALEIANAVGADLIVYGSATAVTENAELVGTPVAKVTVRTALTVVSPDSAEIIADYSADNFATDYSVPPASSKAIKAAADAAIKGIRTRMYEAWRKNMMSDQRVVMEITGVKDYGMLKNFQNLLSTSIRGVKGVNSSRYDKGRATLDVTLTGTAESLASDLSGKTFKGTTVSVTKVSANTLEVSLGK